MYYKINDDTDWEDSKRDREDEDYTQKLRESTSCNR